MNKEIFNQKYKHLFYALGIGLLFRIISSYFVWGPQALDDYLDNLIPAWRYSIGVFSDLHDYRSPLYMWILSCWFKVGDFLGITNSISQIRWIYLFQSVFSLFSIYAVFLITEKSENKKFRLAALYLVVLHGIMPFASSRAFMESFVMGPLSLAVAYLYLSIVEDSEKKQKYMIWGIVILGLSSLVRFQIGVVYIGWMLFALYKKEYKHIVFGFLFGLLLIGLEVLIDMGYGRGPFETLITYAKFNSDPTKAPAMPWYNTWFTLLGVMYFPFSFALTRGWKEGVTKYFPVFVALFSYVLVHSIAPHKEERYLYPILPLALLFLAYAWSKSSELKWIKGYNTVILILNTVILYVGCFINTQVGLIGPLGEIQAQRSKVLYIDYDDIGMRDLMSDFFVRNPSVKIKLESKPDAVEIKSLFATKPELTSVVILSQRDESEVLQSHSSLGNDFNCTEVQYANSLSDKILYKLKPEKNLRRRPTLYFLCDRKI